MEVFGLSFEFVIVVLSQPAKAIVAGRIRDVGSHRIGSVITQVDDCGRDRAIFLIRDSFLSSVPELQPRESPQK
jgi:hypothetical protein